MRLTPQQEMVRKLARDFTEKELAPIAAEIDETGEFPRHVLDKMAKAGFFGVKIPREYGGQGGDCVSYAIMVEEICRASGVAGIYASSPNSLGGAPFMLVGTEEQKRKYLPPTASGEIFMCFGLTEPDAGSDVSNLQTTAVEDGDYWVLNGRKTFITGAPIGDVAVIFAKTDSGKGNRGITAFIMEMDQEGVSVGKPEKKMGLKGCPTGDIIMEDVRVHKSNMLGERGKGFALSMMTLDLGRIGVAAQALGIAQGAFDAALAHAKDRKQFGKPIAKIQTIGFYLAEMHTKLTAARLMLYEAARMVDDHEDVSMQGAMTKYYVTEKALEVVNTALQIHGGYGYIQDYPIERMYRDIRVFPIFEGTNEIQKVVISGGILRGAK